MISHRPDLIFTIFSNSDRIFLDFSVFQSFLTDFYAEMANTNLPESLVDLDGGDFFDGLTLQYKLGSGSFGQVYLGTRPGKDEVAVKLIDRSPGKWLGCSAIREFTIMRVSTFCFD